MLRTYHHVDWKDKSSLTPPKASRTLRWSWNKCKDPCSVLTEDDEGSWRLSGWHLACTLKTVTQKLRDFSLSNEGAEWADSIVAIAEIA